MNKTIKNHEHLPHPSSFELERMKEALSSPIIRVPSGLTHEEIKNHILEFSKN